MNKKIGIMVAPLMALVFMANCGGGGNKSLDQYSWNEIKEISKSGEAYNKFKIGDTKTVKVGGIPHEVRIIGFNHDYNSDLSYNTNGITFEFTNMISDASGLSLATFWNDFYGKDKDESSFITALDYKNSSLRAALVGKKGDGEENKPEWFRYYGEDHDENAKFITPDDPYYHKSVYDLLPDDLKSAITSTVKIVNKCTSFEDDKLTYVSEYVSDPLFLLSPLEMGYAGSFHEMYVTPYQFYIDHRDENDPIRVKKQVDNTYGHIGGKAVSVGGYVEDEEHKDSARNYAGCFYMKDNEDSTGYWLRSISDDVSKPCAFAVRQETGRIFDYNARKNAFGVAPAFCI